MSITSWVAILVIFVTIWALIKRYETRLVLLSSGLFLCLISWNFIGGLDAFAKAMTKASLIMAICSAMGFAFISSFTKCDKSLVHYLSKPIHGLGVFLIPVCTAITFFINIAIPSASGCAAAVGSTLIPVMLRAGIRPAAAAAAVLAGTIGSYFSPGTSHNAMVSGMAKMEVMEFISFHAPYSLMTGCIMVVGLLLVCLVLGDHKGDKTAEVDESKLQKDDFQPSPVRAIIPLIPIVILVCGNVWFPVIKMGVAQAMLIGTMIALLVTRTSATEFTKQFFNGMGKAYADVMGIIIAASVFAAGLKSAGLIEAAIAGLQNSNEFARWGASIGPWLMGVITGSGDAATLAFNEAVTPHANEFGLTIEGLGGLAFLTGALGRSMSPLAGVTIVVSGIAMVSPMAVVKRTAVPCMVAVVACALLMV